MSSRPVAESGLSPRQRLFLLHGVPLSAEEVLAMEDDAFTFDFIKSKGVGAGNIAAAGIGPRRLCEMGLETADQLRQLGFDTLYMSDPKFASEANSCFGSDAVKAVFLQNASDAVALAGSDAMDILGIQCLDLLGACAGAPTEAAAVLQQLPLGVSLLGVPASVLLDSGIRKAALQDLGYSLTGVVAQTSADHIELGKLGFGLELKSESRRA